MTVVRFFFVSFRVVKCVIIKQKKNKKKYRKHFKHESIYHIVSGAFTPKIDKPDLITDKILFNKKTLACTKFISGFSIILKLESSFPKFQ